MPELLVLKSLPLLLARLSKMGICVPSAFNLSQIPRITYDNSTTYRALSLHLWHPGCSNLYELLSRLLGQGREQRKFYGGYRSWKSPQKSSTSSLRDREEIWVYHCCVLLQSSGCNQSVPRRLQSLYPSFFLHDCLLASPNFKRGIYLKPRRDRRRKAPLLSFHNYSLLIKGPPHNLAILEHLTYSQNSENPEPRGFPADIPQKFQNPPSTMAGATNKIRCWFDSPERFAEAILFPTCNGRSSMCSTLSTRGRL